MNVFFLSNELRFSFCQRQAVICKSFLSYLVICFLVLYLWMGLNQPMTFYINYRFQYRYHKRGPRQHTILKFRKRFRQGFRGKLNISLVFLFFSKQFFYLVYSQRSSGSSQNGGIPIIVRFKQAKQIYLLEQNPPPLYPVPDTIRPSTPLLTEITTTKAHTLIPARRPHERRSVDRHQSTTRVLSNITGSSPCYDQTRIEQATMILKSRSKLSKLVSDARTRARGGIIVRYNRSSSSAARMAFTPRQLATAASRPTTYCSLLKYAFTFHFLARAPATR